MFVVGRIDRTPAKSTHAIDAVGKELVWRLDVRGEYGRELGTLTIRTIGDLTTGRLIPVAAGADALGEPPCQE